jgi:predicted dehydrogenase
VVEQVPAQGIQFVDGDPNAQFLAAFAESSVQGGFSGTHMTAYRRVPESRAAGFRCGSLLQQDATVRMPNQYMHRSVQKSFAMDPFSGGLPDHLSRKIDQVQQFLGEIREGQAHFVSTPAESW